MSRLIISGTREELSAEDLATMVEVITMHARQGEAIGVGDCPTGVDAIIRRSCTGAKVFYADWDRLALRAGPERNGRMVAWAAEEPGSVLLAFPGPTSRGTWDCVRQARAAGLDVVVTRIGGGR